MAEHDIQPSDASAPLLLHYTSSGNLRLDHYLAETRPECSRARWQSLVREGCVRVNDRTVKPNHTLRNGDTIVCILPAPVAIEARAEDIPLEILFEDSDVLVLNKPAGLVVHPAPGHATGTLVNALLHHCPDLAGIGGALRPGIVHRLDRDTTGCLVVAKNDAASLSLTRQFQVREVTKTYLALVWGTPHPAGGTIHTLIARHPHQRKKMAALPLAPSRLHKNTEDDEEDDAPSPRGREAITHYRVETALGPVCLLRVRIETGRTHQIRVHLAHRRHPVVGDTTYGRARAHVLPAPVTRQMLHAAELSFLHPRTGERLTFTAPLPPDFQQLLEALKIREAPACTPPKPGSNV
jgi:23S rRNA pseudouridine1911/1915/1917 synthase